MNRILIINYIKRLSKQDIINFANKQNIIISEQEINTIYFYIKNKYNEFLNGNHEKILLEIKPQISYTTYNKILELYELYKNKL